MPFDLNIETFRAYCQMEMIDSQNDGKGRHTCSYVRSLYFHKLSLLHYTYPVLNYREQEVRKPSIFSCASEESFTKNRSC